MEGSETRVKRQEKTLIKWVLVISALLSACSQQEPPGTQGRLTAAQVLASDDVAGFLRVTEPRRFTFPADHGRHPGYRNEWWYLTGNLETEQGEHFGYQVTFFASALRPDESNDCESDDTWCTNHLWMGHAAVTDSTAQMHYAAEIFSRQEPGLAGVQSSPWRVWIQDWQMFSAGNDFPWEVEVFAEDFALALQLEPLKEPVLQGDAGLSQKSPDAGNASYYYSITRLQTTGQVFINDQSHTVTGSSWLDREWSTSALAAVQSGWDWFSLQLDDGSEFMYYQLRDLDGNAHPNSSGNYTSLVGTQTPVSPGQVSLEELDDWTAPDGTRYTTRWRMTHDQHDWIIDAVIEDQLMAVTFQYWEGAVVVSDADSGEALGRGYLEMVR